MLIPVFVNKVKKAYIEVNKNDTTEVVKRRALNAANLEPKDICYIFYLPMQRVEMILEFLN